MISAWKRWKRIAHRAAEIQANGLFLLLYFLGVVPIRALGIGQDVGTPAKSDQPGPHWIARGPITCDLPWARRQF
jgi:hypothetical protein